LLIKVARVPTLSGLIPWRGKRKVSQQKTTRENSGLSNENLKKNQNIFGLGSKSTLAEANSFLNLDFYCETQKQSDLKKSSCF
jgi:hypothetical protein